MPTSLSISRGNSRALRRQGLDSCFWIAENGPRRRWSKAAAFCNNLPVAALKGTDKGMQLDRSRTTLSSGGGKPSAEKSSGLDSCGTGVRCGGAVATGNARYGRMGSGGQAGLHRPSRAGTVVRAVAVAVGAMARPGLLTR